MNSENRSTRGVKDVFGEIEEEREKKVLLCFSHGRQSSQVIIIPFLSPLRRVHYSFCETGDAEVQQMQYPSLDQRCTRRFPSPSGLVASILSAFTFTHSYG